MSNRLKNITNWLSKERNQDMIIPITITILMAWLFFTGPIRILIITAGIIIGIIARKTLNSPVKVHKESEEDKESSKFITFGGK